MESGERNCSACDGSALDYPDDPNSEPCPYCKETPGKETYSNYTAPNLNVANVNAYQILKMLGLYDEEDSSAGHIENKDLPAIRRKLIMVKNKGSEDFNRPSTDTISPKRSYVDKSGSTPEIKTSGGARFIDMGLDNDRMSQYIAKLLEIINYAQEHGYDIAWH